MILLYSTGLDSELYRLLLKPSKLLFFKSGAKYEHFEHSQLTTLTTNQKIRSKIIIDDTLNFKKLEDKNSIVPMRNIYYLLRAFEYSNEVAIGVTYYDLHYDKQVDVLGALISFIQSYYYFRDTPKTWKKVTPKILTPFREYTKGQLLALCIEKGININHIPTLRSCYSGTSIKGCGLCKSCVQKAIALAFNNLYSKDLFDNDPKIVGKKFIKKYEKECDGTIDPKIFLNELSIFLDAPDRL